MNEQKTMNHCERWEPALHDFIEGLLPPELAERVQTHLDSCAGCRQLVAEWERVGQLLAELPVLPAPVVQIKTRLPERRPLFQSSQVAALWAGMALPGAWLLQQLASAFPWQAGLVPRWSLPGLNTQPWLDSIRHWAERFLG